MGLGSCTCREASHPTRLVVLTGGPGAGKTAVLEVIRRNFCEHVVVLPEAAGLLFGGGFPRVNQPDARKAAQRAIFHVQLELERMVQSDRKIAVALCDRGTLDGIAYWPGPGEDFLVEVGFTRETLLGRYHSVIHLRTPDASQGYDRSNPLRLESAAEAKSVDERITAAWAGHPHLHVVDSTEAFIPKLLHAMEHIREEVPDCCRPHLTPGLESRGGS